MTTKEQPYWMNQPKVSEAKKLRVTGLDGESKVSKLAVGDCIVLSDEVEIKVKGIEFRDGKFYYETEENLSGITK